MAVEALPYKSSINPTTTILSRIVQPTGLYNPPSTALSLGSSALAFHPHEMIVASGSVDGSIRLHGAKLDNKTLSFELPLPPVALPPMTADSS